MTALDVVELGRRAVAAMEARGIAWAPGMAGTAPTRSGPAGARWRVTLGSGGVLLCSEEGGGRGYTAMGPESIGLVPDFTDPATLGCLLALVREAWGEPLWCPVVVWVDPDGELYDSRDAAGHREPFWASMADLAAYYRAVRWRRLGEPMPPDLVRHASEVSLMVEALEAAPVRL